MKRLFPILLCLIVSGAVAQAQTTITLTGTVTDGGGAPLEGIEVEGFEHPHDPVYPSTVTAADGTYTLTVNVDFIPFFKLRFFDPAGVAPTEWWQEASSFDDARFIVGIDGDLSGVDAVLDGVTVAPVGGAIEGTVSGAGGPLAGIQVTCERSDVRGLRSFGVTASDGTYRCGEVLPSGDYQVRFEDPGNVYATELYDDVIVPTDATLVPVTFGATTPAIDAVLDEGGAITGYIIDSQGQDYSVSQAILFAQDSNGDWVRIDREIPDFQDGFYVFPGVRPGTYRLAHVYTQPLFPDQTRGEVYANGTVFQSFEGLDLTQADLDAGTPVTVSAGQATPFINGVLEDTGNLLTGTVTDVDGNPLAGVQVRLWRSVPTYDTPVNGRIVFTEADGSYRIEDWPTFGEFHLQFTQLFVGLSEFYDDVDNVGLATPLVVTGTTTGIDVVLDGGSNNPAANVIRGTVTDSTGAPLSGIAVTCWTGAGPAANCVDFTAADGSYELTGQPAGTYFVYFGSHGGSGLAAEWYDDTFFSTRTPVTVSDAGPTTGIDGELELAGQISGSITAPGNVPLEGDVTLFAEVGGLWLPVAEIPTSGIFNVAVQPKTYRVRFEAGFDPFTQIVEYYDDQPTLALADDVVVAPGGITTGIDAVLFDSPVLFQSGFENGDMGGWTVMIEGDPTPTLGLEAIPRIERLPELPGEQLDP
ncbi:MAG: hypothetical protein AAGD38_02720 [Acidobacteriota bacterium]